MTARREVRAQNHAQQVLVRGPRSHVDDRAVTPEDFAPWQERFAFTIDAAASPENAKLPRFWTAEDDALEQDWSGERVFCNPPYSAIEPWPEKAHRSGAELVVMLLPANRTEQGWWQRQIEPHRRAGLIAVEFLPGRMRFLKPGQKHIAPNERPPFGCCLVIWGNVEKSERQEERKGVTDEEVARAMRISRLGQECRAQCGLCIWDGPWRRAAESATRDAHEHECFALRDA